MRYLGKGGPYWTPNNMRCGRATCGQPIEIWLSPNECTAHLIKGKQQQLLDPNQEQVIGNLCASMVQARGG
jgi:hypothetical protein